MTLCTVPYIVWLVSFCHFLYSYCWWMNKVLLPDHKYHYSTFNGGFGLGKGLFSLHYIKRIISERNVVEDQGWYWMNCLSKQRLQFKFLILGFSTSLIYNEADERYDSSCVLRQHCQYLVTMSLKLCDYIILQCNLKGSIEFVVPDFTFGN